MLVGLAILILYAHYGTGFSKSECAPSERKMRVDREGIAKRAQGSDHAQSGLFLVSVEILIGIK
jgi:hypothetical protein